MIKEDWEQKRENDEVRMRIIDGVMKIRSKEKLERIERFTRGIYERDLYEIPMDIMTLAEMLDIPDIVRVLDAIDKSDMAQIAARQMKEAFTIVLEQYIGADEEE